jgi:hypothetical protein
MSIHAKTFDQRTATDTARLIKRLSTVFVRPDPTMAEKLCAWLTDDHDRRLHEVQVEAPDDAASVQLVVEGRTRSLERLSMGQRRTAILLLLFTLEGRLLILAQPEDHLDQSFLFEDVVGLLRAQKGLADPIGRRQIIAATHNRTSRSSVTRNKSSCWRRRTTRSLSGLGPRSRPGEIFVRAILEGGAQAFRHRAEKHGGRA